MRLRLVSCGHLFDNATELASVICSQKLSLRVVSCGNPKSNPETEDDLDRTEQDLRRRRSVDCRSFTAVQLAQATGISNSNLSGDSMMLREILKKEREILKKENAKKKQKKNNGENGGENGSDGGNGGNGDNETVRVSVSAPLQHRIELQSSYQNEIDTAKGQHKDVKKEFLKVVEEYDMECRTSGVARPLAYKFWQNCTKIEFNPSAPFNSPTVVLGNNNEMNFKLSVIIIVMLPTNFICNKLSNIQMRNVCWVYTNTTRCIACSNVT